MRRAEERNLDAAGAADFGDLGIVRGKYDAPQLRGAQSGLTCVGQQRLVHQRRDILLSEFPSIHPAP